MHYNYWVKWLIILRFYGKYGYLEIKSFSSSLPCIPLFFTSLYSSLSLLFLTFLFHTFSFPSSTHSFLPDPSITSFPYIPFVIYLFPSLSFLVSFLLFVLLFLPFLFAVSFPYLPLCFFPSSSFPHPFPSSLFPYPSPLLGSFISFTSTVKWVVGEKLWSIF